MLFENLFSSRVNPYLNLYWITQIPYEFRVIAGQTN